MIYAIVYGLLYLPLKILYPSTLIHKERLPKDGIHIYTSNHYSNVDPLFYALRFKRKIKFLAKIEIFKNKIASFLFKKCGVIGVDRENPSISTFREVLNTFKNGKSLFIFPEGTRNKSGSETMSDAKAGTIVFASKGKCDIVPLLIYKKPKIFRRSYIIVGDAITLDGENTSKLTKEEEEANLQKFNDAMKKLRIEIDEIMENKKRK